MHRPFDHQLAPHRTKHEMVKVQKTNFVFVNTFALEKWGLVLVANDYSAKISGTHMTFRCKCIIVKTGQGLYSI